MLFPSTTPLTSTNSEESAELENGREMGPFLEHEEVGVGIPDKRDVSNPTLSAFFFAFLSAHIRAFPVYLWGPLRFEQRYRILRPSALYFSLC
jgi:hypothetical protein